MVGTTPELRLPSQPQGTPLSLVPFLISFTAGGCVGLSGWLHIKTLYPPTCVKRNLTSVQSNLAKGRIADLSSFAAAIETAGTWHDMAIELTQEIGRRITTITEDTRKTTFVFKPLPIAIQTGNAVSFHNTMIIERQRRYNIIGGPPKGPLLFCWLSSAIVCRLSSSVTLPAGRKAGGRACGRSGGRHCMAGQSCYLRPVRATPCCLCLSPEH